LLQACTPPHEQAIHGVGLARGPGRGECEGEYADPIDRLQTFVG
jgi:hypothetical protein